MSAIIVKDLVKRYGRFTAVRDVSFEVAAGQVTALLGPNGAGKTTTIEILEGFLAPTAGTVQVLGANPRSGGRAWRARIGLVLQTTSLDAQLTVAEALMMFGALYPKPRRVAEVLDLIDLAPDARTRIGALSGGQRRRVDLGLAIIGQPEMLFLDEPTTGLDPEARRRLWSVIETLTAAGTTVLLTTHYLDEAQYLASRVIVLADGRIVADASPDELRAMGGVPLVTFRLPSAAPALPPALAQHALGLVTAREEGVLRRWHASPLPAWAYFAGRILATMAVTAAAGLILVLVAVGMTGVHLTAHAVVGLLVVDMLAALALAAIGTAITVIIPTAQSAQPVLMLTYIPLIVLGGAFGAITSLPHWVNTAMTYLPVQPVIDAASRSLQGGGVIMSGHDLAVLSGWVVGGLLVSFRFFAWDPHRPAHAGKAEARTTARSA